MTSEFEKIEFHQSKRTDEIERNLDQAVSTQASTEAETDGNQAIKANPRPRRTQADGGTRERAVKRMQNQHGNAYTSRRMAVQRQPSYTAGSLPSPSYVSGTPSPSLTGGGTASAGDSYFVTGGQKGQLIDRAKKIREAYKSVDEAAKKLQKEGAGGLFGYGKDDQMLVTAKTLQGTADGMLKIADAIDSWTGSPNKESIEKGSKAVEYADNLIHAAELVMSIKKLNLTSEKLSDKPNQADVEAWADSIGDTFEKAGGLMNLIPKEGLPGFIVDYYKGLFSAPKNYINAFKTIMHSRYAKLDIESDVPSGDLLVEEPGAYGGSTVWKGELYMVYSSAYFQPKASDGSTLQQFMKKHQKDLGVDLYKVKKDIGKALLQGAISSNAPEDVKGAWSNFVANA
jgi:hypothetical protein